MQKSKQFASPYTYIIFFYITYIKYLVFMAYQCLKSIKYVQRILYWLRDVSNFRGFCDAFFPGCDQKTAKNPDFHIWTPFAFI